MLSLNRFFWWATLMALCSATHAQSAAQTPLQLDIPSQQMADALNEFARQAGLQVLIDWEDSHQLTSPRISGTYTPQAALEKLLANTGLQYRYLDERTISVRAQKPRQGATSTSGLSGDGRQDTLRLARTEGEENKAELPTAQAGEAAPQSVQEVVVTATKRAERLQDVPMSVAVIGSEDIERRGLIGMEDYLRAIPGVSQIDRGSADNTIVIRGIITTPESENLSSGSTVASYFDETPITGAAGLGAGGIDVRPVDLERIEVLRGPQGTTYGSASLSGAMRLIPAKPRLDRFGAKVAASYSNTSELGGDNSMIQGVVNIPLVQDKLAVRAVGYRYDESGFIRNIAGTDLATIARLAAFGLGSFVQGFVQDDVGHMVSTGGRLAALWRPTDRLSLTLTYLTQKIEQDGAPLSEIGKYEQTDIPSAPLGRVRGERGAVADTDIDLASLVLNYDLGWGALTTAASWVDSGSALAVNPAPTFPIPGSLAFPSDFESRTAEVRVASQLQGRWQFLAGLFYEDVDESFSNSLYWPGAGASPFGTNPMIFSGIGRQRDQRAAFGEVSYDLTEKLTATVGGRYFKYDKDERQVREGGLAGGIAIGAGVPVFLESDEGDTSLKASLAYKPAKDTMLYASWAEGFRLGYPTAGLSSTLCDTNNDGLVDGTSVSIESTRRVNSDFLDNYEIGGKFAFLDRRVVLDTSVYHIKWNGLPIAASAACSTIGYTANAGEATSDGVELQASLFVTRGLRIDIGAAYTKAQLSKDAPGLGVGAEDGARLPGSPKVNANLAAQYDFNVAGHNAFVRADSLYVGKFYADLLESPGAASGDYVKIDARAGVAFGSLSAELFVRNLTNEDAFTWRRGNFPTSPFYGYRLRPRTVGIQLGYSFE